MRSAQFIPIILVVTASLPLVFAHAADAPAPSQAASAATAAPAAPSGPVVKKLRTDEKIAVKALDDPANPFKGEYAEWDKWIYTHALPEEPFLHEDYVEDGVFMLDTYVTSDGWLVPLLAKDEAICQWRQTWDKSMLNAMMGAPVVAKGEMDLALAKRCRGAVDRVQARFLPVVPKWLVDDPADVALILPDGRVITLGEQYSKFPANMDETLHAFPGLSNNTQVPDWEDQGDWHLWSADGKLLASTGPLSWWWELTIPDFRQRIDAFPKEFLFVATHNGYIEVYKGISGGPRYAKFDWDGTPEPVNLKEHNRDGNRWSGMRAYDLPIIYAAQHGQ